MSDRRQELYDRIRGASKDEVILEEMIRLGFWPRQGSLPEDPGDEIRQAAEIRRKIRSLATEGARLHNEEAMRKEARRRRLAAAKERRKETKARHERERQERKAAWKARKRTEITYLGAEHSSALGQTEGAAKNGLPDLQTAKDIAAAMQIDVGELRWLAFHRKVSETTHYVRFTIPKKTGGERLISAPMPRLKAAQKWIQTHLLDPVPVHDAAHGFVRGRSIVSNAAPHVGKAIVVNLDLKDFFPSVSYPRVWGLYRSMGYSPEASTIFALLTTEADVTEVELDGTRFYVHTSERRLPQGSPASPAITNLLCRKLDRRMAGLATKLGFSFTRYADDLTFSADSDDAHVGTLLKAVGQIVEDEGFVVHPEKTRVMRRGRRQEVTGLVVNDRLGVPKATIKQWRAVLFQIERDGPAGKRFGIGTDVFASLTGFASFVAMVDPDRGRRMLDRVRTVAQARGWTQPRVPRHPKQTPPWVRRKREAAAEEARLAAEAARQAASAPDRSAPPPRNVQSRAWLSSWPSETEIHDLQRRTGLSAAAVRGALCHAMERAATEQLQGRPTTRAVFNGGHLKLTQVLLIVDQVTDADNQISAVEARAFDPNATTGQTTELELDPRRFAAAAVPHANQLLSLAVEPGTRPSRAEPEPQPKPSSSDETLFEFLLAGRNKKWWQFWRDD